MNLPPTTTKRRLLIIFMVLSVIMTIAAYIYLSYFNTPNPYVIAEKLGRQDPNEYAGVGDVGVPGDVVLGKELGLDDVDDEAPTDHSEYLDHDDEFEMKDNRTNADKSDTPAGKKESTEASSTSNPPTLMDLKPLKQQNILIIGANTFIGYQLTYHMRKSTFDYTLFATFDTKTNTKDPFRVLRGNALRELIPRKSLARLERVSVCDDFGQIKGQMEKYPYIVYSEESTECLDSVLEAMTPKSVLVLLRPWSEAYKKVGKDKVELELTESEATSTLATPHKHQGKVIELVYSDLVGFLSTTQHSTLHQWSESLTRNEVLTYRKSKQHGAMKRDHLHRQDFSNAIHLAFQSVEEGRFDKSAYELINVASGKSVAEVKALASLQSSFQLQPKAIETLDYDSDLPLRVRFNTDKAKQLLHFAARVRNVKVLTQEYSEWFIQYYFPTTFSMTTYLTAQGDPQRNSRYSCEFNKMEEFYDSIHLVALTNPFVVFVFHDQCSDKLVEEYETPYVRFVKFDPKTYKRSSPNDERFYMFRDFLVQRKAIAPSPLYYPTHTLWTDLFDVWINKNPFDFMRDYEAEKKRMGEEQKYYLYPGRDNVKDNLGSNGWMRGRVGACSWTEEMAKFKEAPFMNAGVCGGEYESMIRLVTHIGEELDTRKTNINCNMPAYNLVLNKNFEGQYRTGVPFTSPFWSKSRDPQYFICHK